MTKQLCFSAEELRYLAIDQYGQEVYLKTTNPRKELMEHEGIQHCNKMYIDKVGGGTKHIGYVIGKRWFRLYYLFRFEKEA